MAYPWPGFGSFTFTRAEMPTMENDSGWNRRISMDRSRPLGSDTDSIVTTAVGSLERTITVLLSPTRFATLAAMVNTTGLFTDWERPDPDSRQAFLEDVREDGRVAVLCSDGTTEQRRKTEITLVSQ